MARKLPIKHRPTVRFYYELRCWVYRSRNLFAVNPGPKVWDWHPMPPWFNKSYSRLRDAKAAIVAFHHHPLVVNNPSHRYYNCAILIIKVEERITITSVKMYR